MNTNKRNIKKKTQIQNGFRCVPVLYGALHSNSSLITAFCDNRLVTHCTVCVCSCLRALPRRGSDNTPQNADDGHVETM